MDPAASQTLDSGRVATLSLAAIGIVYGDIGTSPLYAVRECFNSGEGIPVSQASVLGILSLIFWAITLVVTLKYVLFVTRANNRGEGGILALLALSSGLGSSRSGRFLFGLGLFGAVLFYGDGMITPAISVLSAVEGLQVAAPDLDAWVLPLSLVILVGLFSIQRHGTGRVGGWFGPVMLVWFAVIAALGTVQILGNPVVLLALDPLHGLRFLGEDPVRGFFVLGSVVLAVTGAEALYADMGHFGPVPIRIGWLLVAMPALLVNYFGQGALILADPASLQNPFYLMAPDWALYPLIGLATIATIIASQAVISGVFSITRQAVQLGLLPRMAVEHTSDSEEGQIFMPGVNWGLLFAVVALVVGFRTSSSLAAAYGIAVTGTMAITTILVLFVARRSWGWSRALCLGLGAALLIIDAGFLGSNLLKIPDGGWVPLAVAAAILLLMTTWRDGRRALALRLGQQSLSTDVFLMRAAGLTRVPGTAIFMTGDTEHVPLSLLHNLKHNKALHERVILLSVITEDIPRVPARARLDYQELGNGFFRLIVRYGFFQEPDIPKALRLARVAGLDLDILETSFFVGQETILRAPREPAMSWWRTGIFMVLTKLSLRATDFFRIPPNRVVELGAQIPI